MLFEEYMTWWHLKWFVIYVLANSVLPWYALWRNQRLSPNAKRDEKKFEPWVFTDIGNLSYWTIPFTCFFFLLRYVLMLLCLLSVFSFTTVITAGADIENMGPFRKKLLLFTTGSCMRVISFCFGFFSLSTRKPKVDYSKWLGPDWTPTYEGASMLISNHTSIFEVFLTFLYIRPMPGFIAKKTVTQLPSIGPLATAVGTLFMDRADKSSRNAMFQKILERQQQAIKGEAPPLMIFPEGCTTKGTHLLQFKKGPFASLMPVQPFIHISSSSRGNPSLGYPINIWHWSFIVMEFVWCRAEQLEMPVFAPNEYFWKHHWDGKDPETKWLVFSNAVRQAMADCYGFQLSDSVMETKMEFKEVLWGKNTKQD